MCDQERELRLTPRPRLSLLPFSQKGASQKQATYVPNYFGVLLSLDRTGKVEDAFAHPVYEGIPLCVIT